MTGMFVVRMQNLDNFESDEKMLKTTDMWFL